MQANRYDAIPMDRDAYQLLVHVDNKGTALPLSEIFVRLARCRDGGLLVSYKYIGDIDRLRIPELAKPGLGAELWRHTCCELFIGSVHETAYREFNFSPSRQWASYPFSDYRRLCELPATGVPELSFMYAARGWSLTARLPARLIAPLVDSAADDLELAVTTVVEDRDGNLSYWALHHPLANPDFHDRRGFVLRWSQLPWEKE